MKSKPLEKFKFALRLIAQVVSLLTLLIGLVISADEDTAPHRISRDLYLDPCKSVALFSDAPLSDEEYRATGKLLLEEMKKSKIRTSFLELQQVGPVTHKEEYKQHLQRNLNYLAKNMEGNLATLMSPCEEQHNKKPCPLKKAELQEKIKKICKKWRRFKNLRRRLQVHNLNRKNIMRTFLLMEKHSSKSDTIKQTVLVKEKSLYSKHNRALKRKSETMKLPSRQRRAATVNKSLLWEHGVIPYRIRRSITASIKALILKAMRHFENYTCITFKETEPSDNSSILFTDKYDRCTAYVGNQGYMNQTVSVDWRCFQFDTALHELGHVIGFYHEHARPDRDNYIEIKYTSIDPALQHELAKLKHEKVDSLGEPYDFDSIMHYPLGIYVNGRYVEEIVPKVPLMTNGSSDIGQQIRLSPGDIRQVNKLYNCPRCGGTFQNTVYTFNHTSTPGEPDSCQWRISAVQGETIVLNITYLNLTISTNCSTDYLEVRDGYYFKSPLLGRYCGDQIPDTLKSTRNWLWLHYVTINGGHGSFAASYEVICGDEFLVDNGTFTSPDYPAAYPPDKTCTWKITVTPGFFVALNFTFFQVEDYLACKDEYVAVYDGPTKASPLLGKYCGNQNIGIIMTSGNQMYVTFVSDSTEQKAGFSANVFKDISGVAFLEGNGTFTSLNYPANYPPSKKYTWRITVTPGFIVTLNFTFFQFEYDFWCSYDYVGVYDGPSEESYMLGKYCGSDRPDIIRSSGKQMYVKFVSDRTVQKAGFSADFYTTNNNISGVTFLEDNGTFTSPNYPANYPPSENYTWRITATPGFIVTLNFTFFQLEYTFWCSFDYVAVYDGRSEESAMLGKYCGSDRLGIIRSSGYQMYVKFVSDITVQKAGFSADFYTTTKLFT